MDASLWVAKTGLNAQQTRMSVISNNLANMSTTGYNTRRAEFSDLHYQQLARAGGSRRPHTTVGLEIRFLTRPRISNPTVVCGLREPQQQTDCKCT